MRERPNTTNPADVCELQLQTARLRCAWCQLLRLFLRTANVQSCIRVCWLDAVCVNLRGLQTGLMEQHWGGGGLVEGWGPGSARNSGNVMNVWLNVFGNFGVFTNVSQIQAWGDMGWTPNPDWPSSEISWPIKEQRFVLDRVHKTAHRPAPCWCYPHCPLVVGHC